MRNSPIINITPFPYIIQIYVCSQSFFTFPIKKLEALNKLSEILVPFCKKLSPLTLQTKVERVHYFCTTYP